MFIWNRTGAKSSTLRSTTGSRRRLSPWLTAPPIHMLPRTAIYQHYCTCCYQLWWSVERVRRCVHVCPFSLLSGRVCLSSQLLHIGHQNTHSTTKVGPRCCLRGFRLRPESGLRAWLLRLGTESGIMFIKAPTKIEMWGCVCVSHLTWVCVSGWPPWSCRRSRAPCSWPVRSWWCWAACLEKPRDNRDAAAVCDGPERRWETAPFQSPRKPSFW